MGLTVARLRASLEDQPKEKAMPVRSIVLTALIASCVSSALTLAVAWLLWPQVGRAAPEPQATQDVVRTRQLEVVDGEGSPRVVIRTAGLPVDGPEPYAGIQLMGRDGQARVALTVGTDGSTLQMNDGRRVPRLVLQTLDEDSSQPDGVVGFSVTGRQGPRYIFIGTEVPFFGVERPYEYTARISNQSGQTIWQAP